MTTTVIAEYEHIAHVVRSVEQRIRSRPSDGVLDAETVLAYDIVTHALEFTGAPNALALWRETLLRREFPHDVRAAVTQLMEYLMAAVARGEMGAVTKICDCLGEVVDPYVFRAHSHKAGAGTPPTP
ncbi:MAG: hypothetical protein ABI442_04700 [Gemmatimonadaceae bacterium]